MARYAFAVFPIIAPNRWSSNRKMVWRWRLGASTLFLIWSGGLSPILSAWPRLNARTSHALLADGTLRVGTIALRFKSRHWRIFNQGLQDCTDFRTSVSASSLRSVVGSFALVFCQTPRRLNMRACQDCAGRDGRSSTYHRTLTAGAMVAERMVTGD
jgi:hypothetical protein